MKNKRKIAICVFIIIVVILGGFVFFETFHRKDSSPLSCPYYLSGPVHYGKIPVFFTKLAFNTLNRFKEQGEVIMYLPQNEYPVPKDKEVVEFGDFLSIILENLNAEDIEHKAIRFNSGKKSNAWIYDDLLAVNMFGTIYSLDSKCVQENKELLCKVICKMDMEGRHLYESEGCKCE